MNKLKVGVVGCGLIAKKRHIPAFIRLKNVEVCSVCDKNKDVAMKTARDFRVPRTYYDLSEMLSKEDLDIVDICTPPQIHAPLATECMENNCHVLLEKPMALKVSDCDQMIDVSRKRGVKVCVVHNNIFHPPFLRAKKLVKDGAIGSFIGMRIFLSAPSSEMVSQKEHWVHKLPGGVIGETGPHAVYMSLLFLKNVRNVDVYAKKFSQYPWAPFDEFMIELEGETGISSIALSYASDCWAADIDILGNKSILHIDLQSMLLTHYKRNDLRYASLAFSSLSNASQMMAGIASNTVKVITRRQKLGHDVVIERFVDSILNNQQPPITGEEGRETVRVMEMIVRELHQKYGRVELLKE